MDYKINKLPQSRVEMEVTLTAEEMEPFWLEARKKLSQGVVVKGFRPGKAPADFSSNEEDIYNEAANLAMNKTYPEILEKEKLETIGPAKADIKKLAPANEFTFKISAAIFPEIKLPNYKDIAAEILKGKKSVEAEDKEIDQAIDWLKKSRAKVDPADRPSKKGDFVEIEVYNSLEEKDFDESKPGEKDSFILGENKQLMAGFEDEIMDMKMGDKKSFSLVSPDNHWDEKVRGKKVYFLVKMNLVGTRQLPELSDDWAKSLGKFETVEDLKKSLKEGILKEKEMKEKDRIRLEMIEKIADQTEIELPEELVQVEVETQVGNISQMAGEQNMTLEKYLQSIGKDEKTFRADLVEPAKKNVKRFLVLRQIAQEEKIDPSAKEIEEEINLFMNRYNEEEAKKIDRSRLEDYIKGRLANEKVFQFLENQ